MKAVIDDLNALQGMVLGGLGIGTAKTEAAEALRRRLPSSVLRVFEAMVVRGKRGIVVAENGVCSGCHLHLSSATQSILSRPNELGRCDNCGRYLYAQVPERPSVSDQATGALLASGKLAGKRSRPRAKSQTRGGSDEKGLL